MPCHSFPVLRFHCTLFDFILPFLGLVVSRTKAQTTSRISSLMSSSHMHNFFLRMCVLNGTSDNGGRAILTWSWLTLQKFLLSTILHQAARLGRGVTFLRVPFPLIHTAPQLRLSHSLPLFFRVTTLHSLHTTLRSEGRVRRRAGEKMADFRVLRRLSTSDQSECRLREDRRKGGREW